MKPYTSLSDCGRDLYRYLPWNGRGDRKERRVLRAKGRAKARAEERALVRQQSAEV